MNRPDALFPQALGHADLVSTPEGNWWITLLGIRSQKVEGRATTTSVRETLHSAGEVARRWLARLARTVSCPSLSPPPACPAGTLAGEAVRETFSAKKPLALHWSFVHLTPRASGH